MMSALPVVCVAELARGWTRISARNARSPGGGAISAPSGSTSSAPWRATPRDAGSRQSIGASATPAAPGSTSSSWDDSRPGCSPSSDRNRSAWCSTRSPSEVPRDSFLRNPEASAWCRPSAWTPARSAWAPVTSGRTASGPEVAGPVGSSSEAVVPQAPTAVASEAEAGEAGSPSTERPPRQRSRGGPTR